MALACSFIQADSAMKDLSLSFVELDNEVLPRAIAPFGDHYLIATTVSTEMDEGDDDG